MSKLLCGSPYFTMLGVEKFCTKEIGHEEMTCGESAEEKAAPSTAKFLELYTEEAPGLWVRKTKPQPDSSSIPEHTFEEWNLRYISNEEDESRSPYGQRMDAWNAAKGLK